jgi:hypothetical protein
LGKPEVKRPLGRPSHKWEMILKWVFRKWNGGMDWIDATQDKDRLWAVVNAVMDLLVP